MAYLMDYCPHDEQDEIDNDLATALRGSTPTTSNTHAREGPTYRKRFPAKIDFGHHLRTLLRLRRNQIGGFDSGNGR